MADVRILSGAEADACFDEAIAFATKWHLSVLAIAVETDDTLTVVIGPDDLLDSLRALVGTIRRQPPDAWLYRTIIERDDG